MPASFLNPVRLDAVADKRRAGATVEDLWKEGYTAEELSKRWLLKSREEEEEEELFGVKQLGVGLEMKGFVEASTVENEWRRPENVRYDDDDLYWSSKNTVFGFVKHEQWLKFTFKPRPRAVAATAAKLYTVTLVNQDSKRCKIEGQEKPGGEWIVLRDWQDWKRNERMTYEVRDSAPSVVAVRVVATKRNDDVRIQHVKVTGWEMGDGFSAAELMAGGFTMEELRNAGFSERAVEATNWMSDCKDLSKKRIFTISELRDDGCSAEDMRTAGATCKELKAGGYSLEALRSTGFAASAFKAAGISGREMRKAGFMYGEMRAGGYRATNLGLSYEKLRDEPYFISAKELFAGGFWMKGGREICVDRIAELTGHEEVDVKHALNGVFGVCVVSALSMLLLLLPPPEGGLFDKENGGQDDGAAICPESSFEFNIYHFFYNEECARRMTGDSSSCGVSVVNQVLRYFFGELRIEAQLFGAASIVFLVMVLQFGGVPIPIEGNKLAVGLWAAWMLIVFAQMMSLPIAIGLTGASFGQFREDMAECAVDWAHGYDMIDAVSLGTFVFQPVVLLKLILFWIYWAALIEGVKVYYAARGWAGEVEWKEFICFGSDNGYDYKYDHYLANRFMLLVVLPACAFCILIFTFSLSWIFGVFFTSIVLFAMSFHVFILATFSYICESLKKTTWKKKVCCGKVRVDFLRQSVVSMTWWVVPGDENSFQSTIFKAYIPLALSPLIVYSTWLAAFAYAGHSYKENMAFVRHAYEFTFGAFNDGQFVLPSVNFDIQNIGPAIVGLAEAFRRLDQFTAVEYLQLSLACTLVSFALSIIKTFFCAVSIVLDALGQFVLPPIPFWKLAPADLYNNHCKHALDEHKESLAKSELLSYIDRREGSADGRMNSIDRDPMIPARTQAFLVHPIVTRQGTTSSVVDTEERPSVSKQSLKVQMPEGCTEGQAIDIPVDGHKFRFHVPKGTRPGSFVRVSLNKGNGGGGGERGAAMKLLGRNGLSFGVELKD